MSCARVAALLAALLLAAPDAGRAAAEPGPPRLVLLYLPCTVNRDFTSPYRQEVPYTPNLARLAREGVVFERHVSEAGHSGTAYASILSGGQAPQHHVHAQPSRIPDEVELVTEVFAANGWDSFFWGGHKLASPRYDYAQGVPPSQRFPDGLLAPDRRFRQILARLASDPAYRALVVTNFTVTHSPYSPRHLRVFCRGYPEECARRNADDPLGPELLRIYQAHHRRLELDLPNAAIRFGLGGKGVRAMARRLELLYASNMSRLDRLFGRVLAEIEESGLGAESLIVWSADHGERLYRESSLFHWTHGWELAPEVLTVPLVVWAPGRLAPGRYAPVTRSTDLLPTVAGLAGLPRPAAAVHGDPLRGVDLGPALRGESAPPQLDALSHTLVRGGASQFRSSMKHWLRYHRVYYRGTVWVSLRRGDALYKFRDLGGGRFGFEAFDLATDPFAERDHFDPADPRHAAAAEQLRRYRRRLFESWRTSRARPERDAEALEALRSLGYIE